MLNDVTTVSRCKIKEEIRGDYAVRVQNGTGSGVETALRSGMACAL